MKIKIAADSMSDLSKELIEKYDFSILPVNVMLGTNMYRDGIDIVPQDIFDYVKETKELPKTAALNEDAFREFFTKMTADGSSLIYFSISNKCSAMFSIAKQIEKEFDGKVYVCDTLQLSTGEALLMIKAKEMVDAGKSMQEIIDFVEEEKTHINTSFVPETVDYLAKGGRCTKAAAFVANALSIHPLIEMNSEGQLCPGKKYMGKMTRCIKNYITDLKEKYPNYDDTRCFITHSSAEDEMVQVAVEKTKELFNFKEINVTVAGSVVTGHCGKNTLGLLFVYNK